MMIVAIGWIYVVLMMAITEETVIAALATFCIYGVFPLSIILYVMQAPNRRRKRREAENSAREAAIARHRAAESSDADSSDAKSSDAKSSDAESTDAKSTDANKAT